MRILLTPEQHLANLESYRLTLIRRIGELIQRRLDLMMESFDKGVMSMEYYASKQPLADARAEIAKLDRRIELIKSRPII